MAEFFKNLVQQIYANPFDFLKGLALVCVSIWALTFIIIQLRKLKK